MHWHNKETKHNIKHYFDNVTNWVTVLFLLFSVFAFAPIFGLYQLYSAASQVLLALREGDFTIWSVVYCCIKMAIACFFLDMERRILLLLFTKYEFTTSGIECTSFRYYKWRIPWDKFQAVCICCADEIAWSDKKPTKALCFVQKGERRDIRGRWKVDAFWRYPKIIRMNDSVDLLEEVMRNCPLAITDEYRHHSLG